MMDITEKNAKRLWKRILWIPTLIVLVACASIALFSVSTVRVARNRNYMMLTESGRQQAEIFDLSLAEQYKTLTIFANSLRLDENILNDEHELFQRLVLMKETMRVSHVGIADAAGEGFLGSGRKINVKNYSFFARAMDMASSAELERKFPGGEEGRLFVISVPLIRNGRSVGVVFACCSDAEFRKIVKLSTFDGESYSFVVNKDGDIMLGSASRDFLLREAHVAPRAQENYLSLIKESELERGFSARKIAEDMENGRGGAAEVSYRGKRRYVAYEPLGINGWYLVNSTPARVVEGPARRTIAAVFVLLGIITACFLLLIFYIYRLNARNNRELILGHEQLRQSEEIYRIAANFSDAVLFVIDFPNDKVTFNRNFKEKLGYEPRFSSLSEMMRLLDTFINENDLEAVRAVGDNLSSQELECCIEFRLQRPCGREQWERAEFTRIFDPEGGLQRVIGRLVNIDEEKRSLRQLINLAESDPLTGLLNRKAAEERIRAFLADTGDCGLHALFIADIDDFKLINDGYGHIEGDRTIISIAQEMKKFFRGSDIIGRLGGDEFVALLKDVPSMDVVRLQAADFCAVFEQGCRVCTLRAHVSMSVGIAVTVGGQKSFDELYREADAALYRVKAAGKNDYHIYNDGVA
ncbi:diguanylate cyclase [Cloacibacillus sp.]|uniref:diguanylate cyclase n=1 Tax=Cloacibacillus sp. TaxID=2049023 RepID=UPI0025C17B61|nr:diguanylate cyclase [Cloacibacillus sp.]MCC8057403.1 diguanylate cyclase [Cloacibacillus sp.]